METKNAIPLSKVGEGFLVSVVGVDAGRGLRNRLISMGLFTGTQIRIVRNDGSGPFVISVKNSRMALGRGVADKIMVTLSG
ncbi:MAG: ferrous iron transport protein A [Sedimentisphaerales bacterium]|nr:ferrous iron transport protein A [Sedimentisphaerales bacterium]